MSTRRNCAVIAAAQFRDHAHAAALNSYPDNRSTAHKVCVTVTTGPPHRVLDLSNQLPAHEVPPGRQRLPSEIGDQQRR